MEILNVHPKPKKKKWSVSENTLDKLWASVIKELAEGRCIICGKFGGQAHHIVLRRYRVLRWDIRNGAFLCAECHGKAQAMQWWLKEAVPLIDYEYLSENKITLVDYCKKHGITKDEFRMRKKRELKCLT